MLFYTVGQSRVFLMMLYVGMGIGGWLCLLEGVRRVQEAGTVRSLWLDLLGGAGAAGMIIWGAMRVCDGELRAYALLGAVCGCHLCLSAVRPPVRWLAGQAKRLGGALRPLIEKILR